MQLLNLAFRALKGRCQRSGALSPIVLCSMVCDFHSLISPFLVSAPFISLRKAIPQGLSCTNRFSCSFADRGWTHFEMPTAKQQIHYRRHDFFASSHGKTSIQNPLAKLISLLGSDFDNFSCNDVQKRFGYWVGK